MTLYRKVSLFFGRNAPKCNGWCRRISHAVFPNFVRICLQVCSRFFIRKFNALRLRKCVLLLRASLLKMLCMMLPRCW